jgi:hypothetical protein
MAHPTQYSSQVAIALPSDTTVRRVIGKSYDPEKTLNVIKMFAGTEDMFDATIGLVKAIFNAQGVEWSPGSSRAYFATTRTCRSRRPPAA